MQDSVYRLDSLEISANKPIGEMLRRQVWSWRAWPRGRPLTLDDPSKSFAFVYYIQHLGLALPKIWLDYRDEAFGLMQSDCEGHSSCFVSRDPGSLTIGTAPFIQWLWPSNRVLWEILRDINADRPNRVLVVLLPCT